MTSTTHTIRRPGADVVYDIHGPVEIHGPGEGIVPLLLIGCPMDASGFGTLAGAFTDRTVVTYDPRGTGRSTRTDAQGTDSHGADNHGTLTPHVHAGDLAAIVDELGGGPVDVFASSGGAVNALAWVADTPGQVRTLVAHEPPVPRALPDGASVLTAIDDIAATYARDGQGPAMAKFIMLVSHEGPFPDDFAFPPVDPAQFGLPTEDDGSRDDPLLGQNIQQTNAFTPDVDALRASGSRIIIGRGAGSGEQMAARSARAVAESLGVEVVTFPGDHAGFLGGEYGMTGEPEAFAATLRALLG